MKDSPSLDIFWQDWGLLSAQTGQTGLAVNNKMKYAVFSHRVMESLLLQVIIIVCMCTVTETFIQSILAQNLSIINTGLWEIYFDSLAASVT